MRMKAVRVQQTAMLVFVFIVAVLSLPVNSMQAAEGSPTNKFLTGITQVEMSGGNGVALDNQGTVWSWGANDYGELGDNTKGFKSAAVPVFSDAAKIQFDGYTMVLKKDGTVWYWGGNGNGLNGLGTYNEKDDDLVIAPAQVHHLADIIDIASNEGHHLALKADGTVWTWGSTSFGESGRIDVNAYKPADYRELFSKAAVPKQVEGLKNIVSVHAGSFSSAAINNQGETWLWGHYYGWGDEIPFLMYPVKLEGIKGKKVDGTWEKTFVLEQDGTVWELQQGLKRKKLASSAIDIDCGNFACAALYADGTLSALYSPDTTRNYPFQIAGISDVKDFAVHSVSQDQLMIVKKDGTLWTKVPFGIAAGNESVMDYYNQMNIPYAEMDPKLRQVMKAINVQLNGKQLPLTANPYIYKGVTFVPLRSTFNELGAKVSYIQGKMTISTAGHTLNLTIREKEAFIDGRAVTLEYPPMIINTMTMVPLRFVIEALENKIEWDPDSRLIKISSPNDRADR
ncbi:stalk domain-containing protein [Paenibacillus paridis]|uniref:stalk domain-containing protein n=1 Tax=Paenibacillus paridis TaxID=2583376 RepID=UPI00112399F1|nr:stalk domain-containing protein [Paenibacillus paridis]